MTSAYIVEQSQVEKIITNESTGLMPYLKRKLGPHWDTFQIKPWAFRSSKTMILSGGAGWRFRDIDSEIGEDDIANAQGLSLGRVILVEDEERSMILASKLQTMIDLLVGEWSRCCDETLSTVITSARGSILGPLQDSAVSAGRPNAWAIAVIRNYTLIFREELEDD